MRSIKRPVSDIFKISVRKFLIPWIIFCISAPVIYAQSVQVALPELSSPAEKTVDINIQVSNTGQLNIFSCDFSLAYPADILEIQSIITSGTVSNVWGPPTYRVENGQLHLGMGGSDPLTGQGTLVRLVALVKSTAAIGMQGALTMIHFQFNEGSPSVQLTHGKITVIPDTDPPRFTQNPNVSTTTAHSVILKFNTDEPSRCVLKYGIGSNLQDLALNDYVTGRSIPLEKLQASTSYKVEIFVWDKHGNGPATYNSLAFKTNDVILSLPAAVADPGTGIVIPIRITDAAYQKITSVQCQIEYDPDQVAVVSASNDGTLTSAWSPPSLSSQTGLLTLSLQGSPPLSGAGVLANLNFRALNHAIIGQDILLHFKNVTFNAEAPKPVAQDGILRIRDTQPAVFVEQMHITAIAGQQATIWWRMNEPVRYQVDYGVKQSFGFQQSSSEYLDTWEVRIDHLTPGETYYYRISCTDSSDNGPTLSPISQFTLPEMNAPYLAVQDRVVQTNQNFTVPVQFQGAITFGLRSFQFMLECDPAMVQIQDVKLDETLQNWSIDESIIKPGFVAISASGGNAISSASELVQVQCKSSQMIGRYTAPVHFHWVQANGGLNPILSRDGALTIQGAADNQAPLFIQEPVAERIADDRIRIRLQSSETGKFRIDYGTSSNLGQSLNGDLTGDVSETEITSIALTQTLFYRVQIWDEHDNGPTISGIRQLTGKSISPVQVYLDNTQRAPGAHFDWNLSISPVSNKAVYSANGVIRYDAALLEFVSVSTSGALTASWGDPIITATSGRIQLAMGGIKPLSGQGTFLKCRFKLKAAASFDTQTYIWAESWILNEGVPPSEFNGALLTVSDPKPPEITAGPFIFGMRGNQAHLIWSTDELSDAEVSFRNPSGLEHTIYQQPMNWTHLVTLDQLQSDTDYQYNYRSRDHWNNILEGTPGSFQTPAAGILTLKTGAGQADLGQTFSIQLHLEKKPAQDIRSLALKVSGPLGMLTPQKPDLTNGLLAGWQSEIEILNNESYLLKLQGEPPVRTAGLLCNMLFGVKSVTGFLYGSGYPIDIKQATVNNSPVLLESTPGIFRLTDLTPPKWLVHPISQDAYDSSAVIYWKTGEPVRSKIEYGNTLTYGMKAEINAYTTEQTWTLNHLQSGTLYHIRVSVTDTLGNGPLISEDFTIQTSAPDAVTFRIEDQTASIGDTLVFPVHVINAINQPFTAYSIHIALPERLNLIDVQSTGLSANWQPIQSGSDQGNLLIAQQGADAIQADGTIFTVRCFSDPDIATGTTLPVQILSAEINGSSDFVQIRNGIFTMRDLTPPKWLFTPTLRHRTAHTATLGWQANEPVKAVIDYGISDIDQYRLSIDTLSQIQQAVISALDAGTVYRYRVSISDKENNGPLRSDTLLFRTLSDTVTVTLPNIKVEQGSEFDLPLIVSQVDGFDIQSVNFTLKFNPDELSPLGVSTENTLTETWNLPDFSVQDSLFSIHIDGENVLTGEGSLVWLRFSLSPLISPGQSIPISMDSMTFNAGYPVVQIFSGEILVQERQSGEGIPVFLPDTTVHPDEELLIDVRVGDITGKGIYSFSGKIGFDPEMLNIVEIQREGSLTSGWAEPEIIVTADTLIFHFSNPDPLEGDSLLFQIRVFVKQPAAGQSESPLVWHAFYFNQGRPTAQTRSGRIRVEKAWDAITGTVHNIQTNQLIHGATVMLESTDLAFRDSVMTTEKGVFRFSGLDTSRAYRLWSFSDGYSYSDTLQSVRAGQPGLNFGLLPADGRIDGWIRESRYSRPVYNALVFINDAHQHVHAVNTDTLGYFLFENISRKFDYHMTVTRLGYQDHQLDHLLSDTTVVIQMKALQGGLQGTVTFDGAGLDAVKIILHSQSGGFYSDTTFTNSTGLFLFADIPVDQYSVQAIKTGYLSIPSQHVVTLQPDTIIHAAFSMKTAILGSIQLTFSSVVNNSTPVQLTFAAQTDSGETMLLESVQWRLIPQAAGSIQDGWLTPSTQYLGPAQIIVTDILTDIADTLILSILAEIKPGHEIRLFGDKGFELYFPENSVEDPVQISLNRPILPNLKKFTRLGAQVGNAYELKPEGLTFLQPVIIGIKSNQHVDPRILKLGRWMPENADWELLETFTEDSMVMAELWHFSLYSLIQESKSLAIEYLEFLPNPFSPTVDSDGDGLPGVRIEFIAHSRESSQPLASIEIYNVLGQRLRTLLNQHAVAKSEKTSIVWDGLTDESRMARNGRYFVKITLQDGSGTKESFKPVILVK